MKKDVVKLKKFRPSIEYTQNELKLKALKEDGDWADTQSFKDHQKKCAEQLEKIKETNPSYKWLLDSLAESLVISSGLVNELKLLEIITESFQSEMIKVYEKRNKSIAPLVKINKNKKQAKETIQRLAQELWKSPAHQDKRLSDMAEIIWGLIHGSTNKANTEPLLKILNDLPDKAAGLKAWIREVAPPRARKPGRKPQK